jgi:hypothetical protein
MARGRHAPAACAGGLVALALLLCRPAPVSQMVLAAGEDAVFKLPVHSATVRANVQSEGDVLNWLNGLCAEQRLSPLRANMSIQNVAPPTAATCSFTDICHTCRRTAGRCRPGWPRPGSASRWSARTSPTRMSFMTPSGRSGTASRSGATCCTQRSGSWALP